MNILQTAGLETPMRIAQDDIVEELAIIDRQACHAVDVAVDELTERIRNETKIR